MRIIINTSIEPYFNLATEEYLLENTAEDIFMLWQNAPAVIIGKNQNAYAEVDTAFTERHGIKVVRRLTGGGAVFHDPGNVNFTFIAKASAEQEIDFKPFTMPIIETLRGLGIPAEFNGRNDIVADGCKVSGNAQCVRRRDDGEKWLMHHGTLLYDADMTFLEGALRVNREKLHSKGIKSVTSRVKNIRELGGFSMSVSDFVQYLLASAEKKFGSVAETLTEREIQEITTLSEKKYSTWEWNYGKSPEYDDSKTKRFPFGTLTAEYTIDQGAIKSITISGDFFGVEDTAKLESALVGCRFEYSEVAKVLEDFSVDKVIAGATPTALAELLFGS